MSLEEQLGEEHPSIEFWLTRRGDYIELNKLVVPEEERGSGAGSAFMADLTDLADDRALVLATTPSTDFGASSKRRLVNFYRNFGFVKNEGVNRDHRTKETMYRAPGGGGW